MKRRANIKNISESNIPSLDKDLESQEIEFETGKIIGVEYFEQMNDYLNLSSEEIQLLLFCKYRKNDSLIFNDEDTDVYDNIAETIMKFGFEATYDFLSEVYNYKELIFSPIEKQGMAKIISESDKITYKVSGVKGLAICSKCGNDEIIIYTKQERSADEATSEYYICAKCGNRWKKN